MSALAGRAASKVGRAATQAAGKAAESGESSQRQSVLQKAAKRDPELYVCLLESLHACSAPKRF